MTDIVTDIRDLAVPLIFLLGLNATKFVKGGFSNSKKSSQKGGCGCQASTSGIPKLGGSRNEFHSEVDKLSDNLSRVMNSSYRKM